MKAEVLRHRKTLSILSTTASEWARQISTEHARLLPSVMKCEDNLEHVERKKQELAQILERMEEVEAQLERLEGAPQESLRPQLAKSLAASSTSSPTKADNQIRKKGYRIDRRGSSSSRLSLLMAATAANSPSKRPALHTPTASRHGASNLNQRVSPDKRAASRAHKKDMQSVCTISSSIMSTTRPHTAIATAMPVLEAVPMMRMVQKRPRVLNTKPSLPDSLSALEDQSSPNWRAMGMSPAPPKPERPTVRQVTMLTPPSSVERPSSPGSRFSLYPTISPPRISVSPSGGPTLRTSTGQPPVPGIPATIEIPVVIKGRDSVHSHITDDASTVDTAVVEPSSPSPRPKSPRGHARKNSDVRKTEQPKRRNPVFRALRRCFNLRRRSHIVTGTPKHDFTHAPKRRSLAGFIMRKSPNKNKAIERQAEPRAPSLEQSPDFIGTTGAEPQTPDWQFRLEDEADDTTNAAATTGSPVRQSTTRSGRLPVDVHSHAPTSREPSPLRSHPVSPRESSRDWSKRSPHADYVVKGPGPQRPAYVRPGHALPTPPCSLHNQMPSRSGSTTINFSRKRNSSEEEPTWSSTTGKWWVDGRNGVTDAQRHDSDARTMRTDISAFS